MEDNIILEPTKIKQKNKNRTLCVLFRTLSIIVAVVGIALGIYFGFDEISTFSYYSQTFVTKTVFELWRAFIFWFTGLSCSLCLFSVSIVFNSKKH